MVLLLELVKFGLRRGRVADRIEDPLHTRSHSLLHRTATGARSRTCCTGEVKQMSALRLIELQRVGYRLQHVLRNSAEVSALQAGVVVDAHSGQQRDFFPAQPWNPAVAAVRGQPACCGVILARLEARKSRMSSPLSTTTTLSAPAPLMGGSRISRINRDSQCPATPDKS